MQSLALDEVTQDTVDELIYRCYAYNRRLRPDIAPGAWALIFSNVDAMEARYQADA